MSSEHEKPAYEDVSIRSLLLIGLFTIIFIFVAVFGAQTVYYKVQQAQYEKKVLSSEYEEVEASIAAQKAKLRRDGSVTIEVPATKADSDGANDQGTQDEQANETDEGPDTKPVQVPLVPIGEAMDRVIANYQDRQQGPEHQPPNTGQADADGAVAGPSIARKP